MPRGAQLYPAGHLWISLGVVSGSIVDTEQKRRSLPLVTTKLDIAHVASKQSDGFMLGSSSF